MMTATEYHLLTLNGMQLGRFDTWEEAYAERSRLVRELETAVSIECVELDAPEADEPSFREDIPGEDMGRWNAFLRAA